MAKLNTFVKKTIGDVRKTIEDGVGKTCPYFIFNAFLTNVVFCITFAKWKDFEWDEQKDIANRLKHGVAFHEAQYAFADPGRIIVEDLEHGKNEKRFFCMGKIKNDIMTVRLLCEQVKSE